MVDYIHILGPRALILGKKKQVLLKIPVSLSRDDNRSKEERFADTRRHFGERMISLRNDFVLGNGRTVPSHQIGRGNMYSPGLESEQGHTKSFRRLPHPNTTRSTQTSRCLVHLVHAARCQERHQARRTTYSRVWLLRDFNSPPHTNI